MRQEIIIIIICTLLLSYGVGVIAENDIWIKDLNREPVSYNYNDNNLDIGYRYRGSIIVDINGGGDFEKIQNAIDNSILGDIIYVWDGIYNENILINNTVTLIGNGTENTILKGNGVDNVMNITKDCINVSGFTVTNGGGNYRAGIALINVKNCEIKNNKISSNNWYGIILSASSNNTIIQNNVSSNSIYGIQLFHSHNNTFMNNTASDNIIGMYISSSKHNNISTNNFSLNNAEGIRLESASNNNIVNNKVFGNYEEGIFIYGSSINNKIIGNNILSNDWRGIFLESFSNKTIIKENNIFNSDKGIEIWQSSNIEIIKNNLSNDLIGVYLLSSSFHNIKNNDFINDGIFITGSQSQHFNSHYIPANNYVNGKPLYYYKNSTGINIDDVPVGQIILANCTNCSIKNLEINNVAIGINVIFSTKINLSGNNISSNNLNGIIVEESSYNNISANYISFNNEKGIQIGSSSKNTIMGNKILNNNYEGLSFWSMSNSTIVNNTVSSNNRTGISFTISQDNIIKKNKIFSNNEYGIWLSFSSHNIISENNITNNKDTGLYLSSSSNNNRILNNDVSENEIYGLRFFYAENNKIFYNNIIDNFNQVHDHSDDNVWNDTIGEGNYWSDYESRYPNAVNDGHTWDTPYEIYGSDGAKDYYPLVENVSRVPIYFKPQAMIESITPNPCEFGKEVSFKGIGMDKDGVIITYRWESNLDGILSIDSSFKSFNLSLGNHNISFSVQDDHGLWSNKVIEILKVLKPKINKTHLQHKSIKIIGNENFTEENGVVGGSGQQEDPFVIEGWEINCSGENCIYIENTTAHFVINDCLLYNENGTDLFVGPAGIYLNKVENGVIKNITCYQINGTNITPKQILDDFDKYYDIIDNSYFGTYLLNSNSIKIQNCNFSNIYGGINLRNSNSNTIKNNICNSNYWHSISLTNSTFNTINNNSCNSNLNAGLHIWLSENNHIFKNTCNSNGYAGIELGMCDSNYIDENICNSNRHQWSILLVNCNNSYIRNNICQNNLWGIALSESHSNSILNNNLNFNDINGIYISGSNSNTIKNNTCQNNGNGIFLHGSNENIVNDNICNFNNYTGLGFGSSDHNIIEQNNFSNNKFGIYLDIVTMPYSDSKNNRFSNNIISKNTKLGISITFGSKNNEFYLNDIISNTQQAIDNSTNIWNTSSGFGNFWSDYTGLDNGENGRIPGDGIGDTNLPHQGLDNFPLMEPYVQNLTLENIRILLELDKFEFIVNDPITGSIQIINDNSFNITFLHIMDNFAKPPEYFAINLIDSSKGGFARIDKDLSSIEINAYNTLKIEFTFGEYIWENRLLNNLDIGNYSIFAFFYYGNSEDFELIVSNIVEFRIITNKTTPGDEEINGDPASTSGDSIGLSQAQILSSIAGLTIVIIIISTLFLTSTEVGKFGFFSAIAPLYTKTRKKKKDHEYGYIKGSVRGYILGNPGESYNNIKRTLNLPNGTLAYYLRVLEREHIIRSERDGFRRRFYPAKGSSANDVFDLSDIQRKIKNIIQKLPGISQKEILSYLDISQQKLNYHIQLMVKARIIRLKREGKSTKCYIIDDVSKA